MCPNVWALLSFAKKPCTEETDTWAWAYAMPGSLPYSFMKDRWTVELKCYMLHKWMKQQDAGAEKLVAVCLEYELMIRFVFK